VLGACGQSCLCLVALLVSTPFLLPCFPAFLRRMHSRSSNGAWWSFRLSDVSWSSVPSVSPYTVRIAEICYHADNFQCPSGCGSWLSELCGYHSVNPSSGPERRCTSYRIDLSRPPRELARSFPKVDGNGSSRSLLSRLCGSTEAGTHGWHQAC
jgi:hypothetical protein